MCLRVRAMSGSPRFVRFSDYAIEVEIFCYILEGEFNTYLKTQEALLFSIMEAIDRAGAVVALPTQTTLVTQDSWIDPEKARAAKTAVEKARDPGVPGMRIPPNS